MTDGSGNQAAYHVYYPFGEEATDPFQDQERMKFTGHERDLGNPAGTGDDLDYMHARYCSPHTGRFNSTDPILAMSRAIRVPQMWNRYAYAAGNPLNFIDPTGQFIELPDACSDSDCDELELVREALEAVGASDLANALEVGENGQLVGVDEKFEHSKNHTVRRLAMAINDTRLGFSLELTSDESLRQHAGAITRSTGAGIEMQIDLNIALSYAFEMKNAQTGSSFFASLTSDEVFMHEVGHFFASSGILSSAVLPVSPVSNERALEYENLHRRLKGGPRSIFERISHDAALLINNQ
ncbi:MAG: RHS repeat-associated core domain-containing protein [bacterium]|nr:RHS repeat-associated core domain-containing protein [bacterium]